MVEKGSGVIARIAGMLSKAKSMSVRAMITKNRGPANPAKLLIGCQLSGSWIVLNVENISSCKLIFY